MMRSATSSMSYGNLGDEDGVGAAGDAGVQRDPAGVAAHHLGDHHAMVRFRGGVQAIDGVGREADRGVEAEAVGGLDDVVVDGLGHADERDAALGELVGDGQGAVAADHHQAVQAQLVEHVDAALRVVALAVARLDRVEERVAAVDRAEDRAADAQDAGDVLRHQDAVPVRLDEAVEAVLEAEAGDAVVVGRLDHGANDRVQPRGVAAAGEYSDTPNRFHSEVSSGSAAHTDSGVVFKKST